MGIHCHAMAALQLVGHFSAAAAFSVDRDGGVSGSVSCFSRQWARWKDCWRARQSAVDFTSFAVGTNAWEHRIHKPRLFITRVGMAAYIHWHHIPKRSHHTTKILYNIKCCDPAEWCGTTQYFGQRRSRQQQSLNKKIT